MAYVHNLEVYFGKSLTVMDPPEHGFYRRVFQKAFSPPAINHLGKTLIPLVINRLIDSFEKRGQAELIGEFALQYPFQVIHEMMALPLEDRAIFQKLASGQITLYFDPEHAHEAIDKLRNYLTALVARRRHNPGGENDLIHVLANAEVDGKRLPDDVVIAFFRQLMTAGGDTTYHGFSSVLALLLTYPDQLEAVRQDRTLVSQAIDEGMRLNSPASIISRTPTREVAMCGVTMRPGDDVQVVLTAANRDERHFPDPHKFDIFRPRKRNHVFAFGPHICIGQHLARLEMDIALNALLDRLPGLRLDDSVPPPVVTGLHMRGLHTLNVRFD